MASVWTLKLEALPFRRRGPNGEIVLKNFSGLHWCRPSWQVQSYPRFVLRAVGQSASSEEQNPVQSQENVANPGKEGSPLSQATLVKFQESILSLPPLFFLMKGHNGGKVAIGLCAAVTLLIIVVRSYVARKAREKRPGSVADLVRRGQLRSDRRGISTPLKYDDPFNNPMVKVSKSNSTVEMCGKVYRLAPVTLTKEQQAVHQKRRSRAYQWKRPTVFIKEGDSIPPDVDPDTVRWIPSNHPFATTVSDIDEDLAQTNVYQKHGVPFRIQAEHEALQRKLEALQSEQKLGKLVIDAGTARDFERPYKAHLKPEDEVFGSKFAKSDHVQDSLGNKSAASDEKQSPQ